MDVIQEENEIVEETVDHGKKDKAKTDLGDIQIEIETLDNDEDMDDDVQLYIEYKYCTICHIEQPLRCKHCKTCGYCVATHDHHCPWIGNCVGERNKFWFFWFIQT